VRALWCIYRLHERLRAARDHDSRREGTELQIDLTEADVVLVVHALTQLRPEHNSESIDRWRLIEKLARLLPPGAARTWRA
jgi:hypothetical protein